MLIVSVESQIKVRVSETIHVRSQAERECLAAHSTHCLLWREFSAWWC
jgi:hypothetical protein